MRGARTAKRRDGDAPAAAAAAAGSSSGGAAGVSVVGGAGASVSSVGAWSAVAPAWPYQQQPRAQTAAGGQPHQPRDQAQPQSQPHRAHHRNNQSGWHPHGRGGGGGRGGGRGGGSSSGAPQRHQHQQQHQHQPAHQQHQHHQHQPPQAHRSAGRFRSYPRHWVSAQKVIEPPSAAAAAAAATPVAPALQRPPLQYKLVCYNVLCGAYIEREYFPKSPPWLLADHHRRETILQQLTGATHGALGHAHGRGQRHPRPHPLAGADLIALQEVDSFDSAWKPRMAAAGYDGLMKERTAVAAARADGSAVFWRRDKFQLIDRLDIDYCIYPSSDRKDNVGIGVLLRCIEHDSAAAAAGAPPRYLALVNTHLLYNPKRGDLKVGQMQILTNSVDAWLNNFCRKQIQMQQQQTRSSAATAGPVAAPHIALMVCGDFNAMPSSTMLQLALHGSLDLDSPAGYAAMPPEVRRSGVLSRYDIDGQERHDGARALREGLSEMAPVSAAVVAVAADRLSASGNLLAHTETVAVAVESAPAPAAAAAIKAGTHPDSNGRKRRHGVIDLTEASDEEAGAGPSMEELVDAFEREQELEQDDSASDADADVDELGGAAASSMRCSSDSDAEEEADDSPDEQLAGGASAPLSTEPLFPPASFADPSNPQQAPPQQPQQFGRWAPRAPRVPDTIEAFYPFSETDTPRRIGHALQLRSVLTDADGWAMRQRVEAATRGAPASELDAVTSASAPRTDPLTGLPLRFRPTSHHWRFSGQVDHVLFAPRPFVFRPHAWTQGNESPEQVCRAKIAEQQARLLAGNASATSSSGASSSSASASASGALGSAVPVLAPASSRPAVRVTSVWELPPLSAMAPHERVTFVQVAQRVQSQAQSAVMAAAGSSVLQQHTSSSIAESVSVSTSGSVLDGAAVASVSFATRKQVTRVRDPGLPLPDSPSDHFPLAVQFQLL